MKVAKFRFVFWEIDLCFEKMWLLAPPSLTLKNLHLRGEQVNRIKYSRVKKIMTIVSIYSRVKLNRLFGSISKSSLKSSSVERINVNVETTTIPSEKKAFIYKSGKLMSSGCPIFAVFTLMKFETDFVCVNFSPNMWKKKLQDCCWPILRCKDRIIQCIKVETICDVNMNVVLTVTQSLIWFYTTKYTINTWGRTLNNTDLVGWS